MEVSQVSERLVELTIHDVSSCLVKLNFSLKGKVAFIFLLVVLFSVSFAFVLKGREIEQDYELNRSHFFCFV